MRGTHYDRRTPPATLVVCCATALLCAGCGSAVQRVSDAAQQVQSDASLITTTANGLVDLSAAAHSDFQDLHTALTDNTAKGKPLDLPALTRKAAEGMDLMQRITTGLNTISTTSTSISSTATSIVHEIPNVQDVVPWWASLLKQWGYIIAATGIVVAGFYFGIWPALARLVAISIGWTALLPKPAVTAAKFDHEAASLPTVDPVQLEGIAAKRTADKNYDAAYRAFQKRDAAASTHPTDLPKDPSSAHPTTPSAQEPHNG